MEALTPAERRGALLVVALLVLGATHDLWRATRPIPRGPAPAPAGASRAPEGGPGVTGAHEAGATPPSAPSEAPVDLNRASARELDALPGIGPVLAARIVEHRERDGPYTRPEDLLLVRGIGPRLFERLAPRVVAGPGVPRGAGDSSLYRGAGRP